MSASLARIATGHAKTTEAARLILETGGNAVDAAIAAVLAACVTEPMLASLGGGGHALIQVPDQDPVCLDCFAHTPITKRGEPVDFYPILGNFGTDVQEFHVGLASIATPGLVAGLDALHDRFAKLPKHILIQPACQLAKQGVALNALHHHTFEILEPIIRATPESARWAGLADREAPLPAVGAPLTNPALADFLEIWAVDGRRAFYQGEPGQSLVSLCQQFGGHLQANDLDAYQAIWREPLHWRYRDAKLWSNPPPAFGGMMLQLATRHLEQTLSPATELGSVQHVEALIEAMALTDLDRGVLESAAGELDALRDQFASVLAKHPATQKGTTHISIEDREGMGVALTVSNGEGSGQVLTQSGIMLNNMLGEEDLNRGGFGQWPCNRRLASMMTPTIICRDGGGRYLLGSGGSNRIRTALMQVIADLLDFGLPLQQAIDAPRLHLEKGHLSIELASEWREETQSWLMEHHRDATTWPSRSLFFGGVHAVGPNEASADQRREGHAARLAVESG